MRLRIIGLVAGLFILTPAIPAIAQTSPPSAISKTSQTLDAGQLDALVAPIALYDDNLLSQVLMASTYPLELVAADRWAKGNKTLKGEALQNAVGKQSWDESVKSLVAVPEVLGMMSEKLDWTQKLGDAVLAQQPDVMDSIQRLRSKAKTQGKLTSTKQQKVGVRQEQSRDVIVIEPGEPDTVYVPYYDPAVVYGGWDYPDYPPYYFPPAGYIAAGVIATGIAWGAAWAVGRWVANGGINWGNRNLVVNPTINNIGNRIGNNTNFQNWQHNPAHRQGVRYSNDAVRQKFAGADRSSVDRRLDFRGRDGQQVVRPDSGRQNLGDRRPSGDRPAASHRPAGNQPRVADRVGGNRPAQVNRPARDSSFSNIQSRARVNTQSNRGHASLGNRGAGGRAYAQARGGSGAPRAAARGGRRSDVVLKHDIILLGQMANGIGLYRFSYNGSDRAYVGVLAQEVQTVMPDAVVRDRDGFLRVFYEKLGVKFQSYERWLASGARIPILAPDSN